MISVRTDIVQRAVKLIDPDEHRRVECHNAVHVALVEIAGSESDMRHLFHRHTKRATLAARQLATAIKRLRKVLNDPDLSENLLNMFPPTATGPDGWPLPGRFNYPNDPGDGAFETRRLLANWLHRAEWSQRKTGGQKFHFKAEKKLIAAEQAHRLLLKFRRDISATEGSTFCRLAALLYGKPKDKSFHSPCSKAISKWHRAHRNAPR